MEEYMNDFEKWCRDCVIITDKESGADVPFLLNAPQRRVLGELEAMRMSGKPIRMIMLKARQWGGSTLIQVYMAWIQLVRRRGWSSIICGHVKDASSNIQGFYSRLLRDYPERLKDGNPKGWTFSPYEKSRNISYIAARDCRVAVATALSPDGARSGNYAMAHLSEVAFWGDGDWSAAQKIVRSIAGSIVRKPDTLIVMESTANGKNNYFHYEWQRAVAGESDKLPVFVPWHEIEIYSREVIEAERDKLVESFDDYERQLLAEGVSVEHVAWYHDKRKEYATHSQMMAEYPSTPEEAFATSSQPLFSEEDLSAIDVDGNHESQNIDERLLVVYPTDKANILVEAYVNEGKVCIASDEVLPVMPLQKIVELAENRMNRIGEIMIINNPTAESPHSRWLLSAIENRGLPLWSNEEGESVFELSKQTVSEIVDSYIAIVQAGMMKENSKLFVEQLSSLRYPPTTLMMAPSEMENVEFRRNLPMEKAYERFAGAILLAHSVAVWYLTPLLSQQKLNINDFIR